jgi:tripartite-type tricarboxylate transporter receptor subunit TctC
VVTTCPFHRRGCFDKSKDYAVHVEICSGFEQPLSSASWTSDACSASAARPEAMMLQARILSFALLCAAMLLWSAPASPQGYPVRSIRLVVPFPAGGPSDFLSRVLGQGMSAALGQQIVLENRTGAGGLTGVDAVAKSAPDGYTIGTHDAVPSPSTPQEFTAFVQAEQVKWGPVVTTVGIKLD